MYERLSETQVRGLFEAAGIPVLNIKALVDGYSYNPSDSRFYDQPPRCAWWFVKTGSGWIEIGWRKRVIHIDWSDTNIRAEITTEEVTKSETMVHAYGMAKALEYLITIQEKINTK